MEQTADERHVEASQSIISFKINIFEFLILLYCLFSKINTTMSIGIYTGIDDRRTE